MIYQKYSPAVALQPYVLCYFTWEHLELLTAPVEVQSPPNGLGGMVFNYGVPHQVLSSAGKWERVPYSFVAGQFTRNYSLRLSGGIGMIGIAFMPLGITRLLGIPMGEFTDQRIDLHLVLGKEASRLKHQLLESTANHQRIAVLEQFLLKKLYRTTSKTDLVDTAVSAILERKGILSINRLSDDLCISPRQFRRRFAEKVGVNPKLFSRIKRFNYISSLSADSAAWMDMVYDGGYYDQAHFIREFCEFTGKNPSEFFSYNRALAQLVGA
jgi:AraC-like DNA-binding protein